MVDEYGNPFMYRLKWAYLLLVVVTLMTPVFYVIYISFNANGFGAARYVFTFEWYTLIFSDRLMMGALQWTMLLAITTTVIVVPMATLAAKLYKTTSRYKVLIVFLLLSPLFVPADILGSALLVFFKNMNGLAEGFGAALGVEWFDNWFQLGFLTALVGLIIYTMPYCFVVILITMGRYKPQQTEAARACGASGWRAFWDVEFPQIRAGVFSACSFGVILCFNEYTRTSLLKGGFDTFTTVLISQMLNEGMSGQSYAMSAIMSLLAIALIGSIIIFTLLRSDKLSAKAQPKAEPAKAPSPAAV